MTGTTDVYEDAAEADPTVPQDDVRYLLDALRYLLDPAPTIADVRFAYCGWRSLPAKKGPAGALNREAFLVAERIGSGMLHTAVGGKLTTHRAFAERVVEQVLGLRGSESPTRHTPLPGGEGAREPGSALWRRHGCEQRHVLAIAAADAFAMRPLCPHRPFLVAEAVHAVQQLAALRFSDLMLRRLVHSQGPCLEPRCLGAAHDVFLRAGGSRLDSGFETTADALRAEVARLTGGLVAAPASDVGLRDRSSSSGRC